MSAPKTTVPEEMNNQTTPAPDPTAAPLTDAVTAPAVEGVGAQPSAAPTGAAPTKGPSVFKNRYFRNLILGGLVSMFGDQFYLIALPWLVLQLTGSTLALGTILMCAGVPRAVLMLAGGALSDRIAPRRIMLTTATTRTVLVAAVGVLAYFHVIQLWHLYVLATAFGIADAFGFPAMQALLPTLVEPEQLMPANAAFQSCFQITTMLGPAPAGLIIKAFGAAWAFLLDALSFLFILWPVYLLPRTVPAPRPRKEGQHFGHDIMEGVHYVWRDPAMRALMFLFAAMGMCVSGPIMVGLAALGKFRFNSAAAFGTLLSCYSAGALVGVVLAGVLKLRKKRGLLMLCVYLFVGAGMMVLSVVQKLFVMGTILAGMGVTGGLAGVTLMAWFQMRVDRTYMGRVMSVLMFSAFGLLPVGYAVGGAVAQWSLPGMFLLAGVSTIAATLLAFLSRELRAVD
jgi:MFS family permease